MLNAFKDLLKRLTTQAHSPSPADQQHAAQLATAVLLVEVMRADASLGAPERTAVVRALRERFTLADDELARLIELAEQTARQANDFHRFTNSLNEHFSQPQKVAMVEALWQVAFADAHLDAHENHVISKIAGLLHVTHGEYIAAKLHARQGAGLG